MSKLKFVIAAVLIAFAFIGEIYSTDAEEIATTEAAILPPPDKVVPTALPLLNLALGKITGLWLQSRAGRDIAAFTGIPYGKPPVGDLRFRAPEAAEPWGGILESIALEAVEFIAEEESLFLHVFTPAVKKIEEAVHIDQYVDIIDSTKQLPVMVWIAMHGLADNFRPEYLLDKDVILVTIRYRAGVLGFLSTEDEEAPGNWGLKDQTLALQWIKDNIAAFGGNPNLVTIFGGNAGASHAHLHMFSHLSKGLFHRVIAQSGVALTPASLTTVVSSYIPNSLGRAKFAAQALARKLNCSAFLINSAILKCLRSVSIEILLKEAAELPDAWVPVIESFLLLNKHKAFLIEDPLRAILNKEWINDVPLLAGVNGADGVTFARSMLNNLLNKPMIFNEGSLPLMISALLGYHHTSPNPLEVSKKLIDFYSIKSTLQTQSLKEVTELFTDGLFTYPLYKSILTHKKQFLCDAFVYLFNHRGQQSFTDILFNSTKDFGVARRDELIYIFPAGDLNSQFRCTLTPKDLIVSKVMVELWTNFALTGHPIPPNSTVFEHAWEAVSGEALEYMEIAFGGRLLPGKGLRTPQMHFWDSLLLTGKHVIQLGIPAVTAIGAHLEGIVNSVADLVNPARMVGQIIGG